jgi:hypothetical protein
VTPPTVNIGRFKVIERSLLACEVVPLGPSSASSVQFPPLAAVLGVFLVGLEYANGRFLAYFELAHHIEVGYPLLSLPLGKLFDVIPLVVGSGLELLLLNEGLF